MIKTKILSYRFTNKLMKFFYISGFILWVIETLYFNIRYGWQLEPHNLNEDLCDLIVTGLWEAGFLFFVITVWGVVDGLLNKGVEVTIDKEDVVYLKSKD